MTAVAEESALALIEKTAPVELFRPGVLDPIIDRIRTEALAEARALDISTNTGRQAIASLAFKVARSKTFVDKQGKELVADEKKRLLVIDKERSRVWDELENLQKEIRQPLTDWENAEKERVAAHEAALAAIPEGSMYGATESSQDVEARIKYLESLLPSRDWQEFTSRAKQAVNAEIARTKDILARVVAREHEAAELIRLRAEAAAREQADRERRIAEEAATKARITAEEAARIEREAIERKAREEREAAERAAKEAAVKAEREREEAEARARKAEADRIAAEERAVREKQEAIEAERRRVEEQRNREEAEALARENNRKHAASINNAAMAALVEHANISDEQAKAVVTAICKGLIPAVKISY